MSEVEEKRSEKCKWCGFTLETNAKVCQKCDRNQCWFLTRSRQAVTVSALLAVIASGLNYIYPPTDRFVRSFYLPELKTSQFETESKNSVLINSGVSEVFVSYISIRPKSSNISRLKHSIYHVVNKKLSPEEILNLDLESITTKRIKRSDRLQPFDLISHGPQILKFNLLKRLRVGDPGVRMVITGDDHHIHETTKILYKNNNKHQLIENITFPYQCEVHFIHRYSEDTSPFSFDCTGILSSNINVTDLIKLNPIGKIGV